MDIDDANVKIRVRLSDKEEKLLANAVVYIETVWFGWIVIKGWCIWRSQKMNDRLGESLNITPPQYKSFGWKDVCWLEDTTKWYELEERIYSAYHMSRTKKKDKEKNINEDIDPEDMPVST